MFSKLCTVAFSCREHKMAQQASMHVSTLLLTIHIYIVRYISTKEKDYTMIFQPIYEQNETWLPHRFCLCAQCALSLSVQWFHTWKTRAHTHIDTTLELNERKNTISMHLAKKMNKLCVCVCSFCVCEERVYMWGFFFVVLNSLFQILLIWFWLLLLVVLVVIHRAEYCIGRTSFVVQNGIYVLYEAMRIIESCEI